MNRARLTPSEVSTLIRRSIGAPQVRHPDGDNMYLVTRNGRGFWVVQYWDAGKSRSKGLGPASDMTPAQARRAREQFVVDRRNGAEIPHRGATPAAAAGRAFAVEAADYLERHASEWSPKQRTRYKTLLRLYAAPLDKRPVTAITVDEVKACLEAAGWPSPKAVLRLRPLLEKILNAAGVPQPTAAAASRLDMSKMRPKSKPHPSLPWEQAPVAMQALNGSEAARVLRFIMLTGARRGEGVNVDWSEIDLVKEVWSIPAERMKMKEAHRVPLSAAAIACLGDRGTGRVFKISHYPVAELWDRLRSEHDFRDPQQDNKPATIHGFRTTIATWAQEQRPRYQSDVIEAVLAHAERNKVKAAYQRSDLLEERKPLMEAWAAFVTAV